MSALLNAGMWYILPLRETTGNIENMFYEDHGDNKGDSVFNYNKYVIWFRKRQSENRGNFTYAFWDDSHRSDLGGHYVEQADKHYGEKEY